jgi:hypothetical protein
MKDKAKKLIEKYEELESELGNPEVLADQVAYAMPMGIVRKQRLSK